jgi:hypothetical protein
MRLPGSKMEFVAIDVETANADMASITDCPSIPRRQSIASRLHRIGGAPMWVRSMEGLGVVFTEAKHCHKGQ